MNKSKHFIFAVMAIAITLLIFGSRAASAQATNTGIFTATPTLTSTLSEGSDIQGEPLSEEEQEEIKAVVREYVDVRYRALSVSDAEDFKENGLGNLVSTTSETEAFRSEEIAKLAVEIKRAEVYHLRYVSYNYFLNFEGITFDPRTQTTIVLMIEGNEVVYETSAELAPDMPIVSHSAGIEHTVLLQKAQGQWKIVSDTYNDDLWRMLRHGDAPPPAEQPAAMLRQAGESTDAILGMAEEMMRVLDLAPKFSLAEKVPAVRESISTFDVTSSGPSHPYDRDGAVQYALDHWNFDLNLYNPNYPRYPTTDCQNFVSQALYEGGNVSMYIPNVNAPPTTDGQEGWYSFDEMRRASAWNDVDAFYNTSTYALIDEGPAGELLGPPLRPEVVGTDLVNDWPAGLEPGDVIQYEWLQTDTHQDPNGPAYDHSAIVVAVANGIPYVAAHTEDHDMVEYYRLTPIEEVRFIHIKYSHGNPPIKAEMNRFSEPDDDAGGNPANPCLNTNGDFGNNYLGSCFNGGNITSGFLFRDIEIPNGAQIKYAYITFTTDGTYVAVNPLAGEVLAPISLQIYGENNAFPLEFSLTNTPADRATFPSPVSWPINGTNGFDYDKWSLTGKRTTPDIKTIIQDITELGGWNYGNPLSIIFKNAPSQNNYARRVLAIERVGINPAYHGYWSARLVAAYEGENLNVPPTVQSIVRASGDPTSAASVNFTVTFSEPVTGVNVNDFALVTSGIVGATINPVISGSGSIYTVTVNTGKGNGTIRLDVPVYAAIVDEGSEPLYGLPYTLGQAYTVTKASASLPTPWAGSISIQSDKNVVTVVRPHLGSEIASYNGSASGSLTAYLPMLFKDAFGGSYDSAFYIQNVHTSSNANIVIKFYDSAGTLSCTKNEIVGPLASKGYWLPSETCLPAGWVGGAVITSNQPVVTVGRPHIGAEIMTYNGFSSGGLSSYIPMLFKDAFGGSYDSAFYVQNVHVTNTANLTIKFYSSSGALSCTKTDTLSPFASKGYWVPGETCLPVGWVGGVVVTSNQPVVTVGRPHIGSQITTYNGSFEGNTSSYIPMLFKDAFGGSYDSAFYVQNTQAAQTASLTIKFYDGSGNLSCTKNDTVAGFASKGYWLPDETCLPAGWSGGALILSSQPVVSVARPHIGDQITTYKSLSSGGVSSYLPMLFNDSFGGAYDSAFYIQNTEAASAFITASFYDEMGALTCVQNQTIAPYSTIGLWLPSLSCAP